MDTTQSGLSTAPLSKEELARIDAYWRAANYLTVGQIYLLDNPLLREPLRPEHIKPRLLGHWGTSPGLSLVYAHLNRIDVRRGERVAQNDTIGFVGQTGWATGPHLHYEFRIAGKPRNPFSIALPAALPKRAAPSGDRKWRLVPMLLPYLWEYRGRVAIALACLIAAKLANVGVPLILKEVVDGLDPARAVVAVWLITVRQTRRSVLVNDNRSGSRPAVSAARVIRARTAWWVIR